MGESRTDPGKQAEMPMRNKVFFSLGEVGDNVAYQTFSFLVFTYYFAVIGLPVLWISAGFIIWAIWNAVNDNLVGILSDRTKTRLGRRRPWMIAAVIPLAIIMVLLFTVPPGDDMNHFIYFMCVLFAFDGVYSLFNVNYNAMFSEMFVSVKDRAEVGRLRGIFVVIALVFALVLPSLMIEDMANEKGYPYTAGQYVVSGSIAAIIIAVIYTLVISLGIKERVEFSKDSESAPGFIASIKHTFRNKSFRIFLIAAMATWICNGILPSMFPLFATYALGIGEDDPMTSGIVLLISFIVGAATMPVWARLRKNRGARFVGLLALAWWGVSLLILMMAWNLESGIVAMVIMGFGLGGSIYFYDQCIAEIIDEDEVNLGTRRSGSYYGVITFIIRLSTVLNFVIVGLLFTQAEWEKFTPNPGVEPVMALRFLIGVYPAIVLGVGLVSLWKYPIHGKRLQEIREKLDELHSKKRSNAAPT
ncbi:MAG: MFS transporter [Candidatus Lokiarchaeota archaeon]|nr:MFS transporter [Candidatus Lokiarchaeota archaeon]